MSPARLSRMVWQNLRRARRQSILSVAGIAVGIASLAFFLTLSEGVREVVLRRVFHVDRIEIEPPRSSFDLPGLFGVETASLANLISDAQVARLRSLPGVRSVAPRMRLAFPAKAWGGERFFGGASRFAEVIGEGLDPQAVAGESFGPIAFADHEAGRHEACNADPDCHTPGEYCAWDVHQCQKPVPVIVSRFLVELYNTTFASAHGLPRIGSFIASQFSGFTFTVELGTSFIGSRRAPRGIPRQRRVMLVGISDRAVNIGVSFPLQYVRRWNAEYAGKEAASGYTSVVVEVSDKKAVTEVVGAVREMKLRVVESGAEQVGLAITLLTLLLVLVSVAIVAVAVMNIGHTFYRAVTERRREIGVLRALGATRGDVVGLLLGEAAAVGLAGGLIGLGAARFAAFATDWYVRKKVPYLPFGIDTFFDFSPEIVAGCLLFAVVVCLLGAAWPARAAARLEPATALTAT